MRRHGNVNLSTHQAYSPQFNSEKHANCDNFPASIAGDQLLAILSYDPKYFTQICRHLYTIISAISTTWPCRTSISASDSYLTFTALSRPVKVFGDVFQFFSHNDHSSETVFNSTPKTTEIRDKIAKIGLNGPKQAKILRALC